MSVLFTVLSFPFWFFGIFTMIAAVFGTVKYQGVKCGPKGKTVAFLIGICLTLIAFMMV